MLTTGLAHEINNPASAAVRAVEALPETIDTVLSSLVRLARLALTAEQPVGPRKGSARHRAVTAT